MGNLLSGDVNRLTPFGGVKASRRLFTFTLFSQPSAASVSREVRHAR